jgi:hypothetical protein
MPQLDRTVLHDHLAACRFSELFTQYMGWDWPVGANAKPITIAIDEADMQRFLQRTPPSVHSMVLTMEWLGFIRRVPHQARSITLLVPPESLPRLKCAQR